jgi:hypothetical protein
MENLSLRVEQVMAEPALSAEGGLAILPQGYNPPGSSEGERMAAFSSLLVEATVELSSLEATEPRREEPSTPQDINVMNGPADGFGTPSHLTAAQFPTALQAADPPEGSYSEGLIESAGTFQKPSPIIPSGENSVLVSMTVQADTIMGSSHTDTPPDRSVETAVNREPGGLREARQVETIPSPEPVSSQQGWMGFATGDENITVARRGDGAKNPQLSVVEGSQPLLPDVSKTLRSEVKKSRFTPYISDTPRLADQVVPPDGYAERASITRSNLPHLISPNMEGKETLPRMAGSYLRSPEGIETSRDSGATASLYPPLNHGDDQGAARQSHYGDGYQNSNRNNGENFLDLVRGSPPSGVWEKAAVETLNISPLPQSALQEAEISVELQGVKAPLSPSGREGPADPFIHPEIAEAAKPHSARTVMDQIVQRAIPLPGRGNHRVRLALKPDALGSLELDVSIRNGGVTSHMTTQTMEAKELIGANLHLLREALQQHGLHIEQLVISVEQEQSWSEGRTNGSPLDRHDGGKPEEETPPRHGEDTLSSAETDYDLRPWTIDLVV